MKLEFHLWFWAIKSEYTYDCHTTPNELTVKNKMRGTVSTDVRVVTGRTEGIWKGESDVGVRERCFEDGDGIEGVVGIIHNLGNHTKKLGNGKMGGNWVL